MSKGQTRIGISGWNYAPWRGIFYPEKLPHRLELSFASRQVNSIEINGSFYSLQRPESYQRWYNDTPADFLFSVKATRFITHLKRLKDVEKPLSNFLASGILALREKLGPILWQFPPGMKFDPERFETFLKMLPRDTQDAALLARKCDAWMHDRSYARTDQSRTLRHAFEVRNSSFVTPEFVQLLRRYHAALVIADTAGKWPFLEDVTSDFVYVRLHGKSELYVSGYDEETLNHWANRIEIWQLGGEPEDAQKADPLRAKRRKRDVFVYFDNDVKVRAPYDAISMLSKVSDFEPEYPMPKPGMLKPLAPRTRWPAYSRKKAA